MTTQIMFKIEKKLKKAAQKKAKKSGITLSDFYQSATRSFVEGQLDVGLITNQENWHSKSKKNLLRSYSSADSIYDSI